MKPVVLLALVAALTHQMAAAQDFTLSPCYKKKAKDCVASMTLDQKIGQMTLVFNGNIETTSPDIYTYGLGGIYSGVNGGPKAGSFAEGGTAAQWADMTDAYQRTAAKSKLKIPLLYGADAIHGHNNVDGATIFPHASSLGAANDVDLVRRIAEATRREMMATGVYWTFAPMVAVPQDDRWGRTYEAYSEDPEIVASLGASAISGFQRSQTAVNGLSVLATAKHYIGDGGTAFGSASEPFLLDQGDMSLDEEYVRTVLLAPYVRAVETGVGSVMASFNSINGSKAHGSAYWLTDVLKTELGFKGFVVSDWDGVNQISGDYAESVRTAVNAGVDMVMLGGTGYVDFIATLKAEVEAGNVAEERINDAVERIVRTKKAMRLFDRAYAQRSLLSNVGGLENRGIAREAVAKTQVLLKKEMPRRLGFPLSKTTKYSIVVAGPKADSVGDQCGGWSITWQGGSGATVKGDTLLRGIAGAASYENISVVYEPDAQGSFKADYGIAVIGESPYAEGFGDTATLGVDAEDVAIFNRLCDKVDACIVVVLSGRPVIIADIVKKAHVVVWAGLPGSEGGGVADVLFGDMPFTGKLPFTWPKTVAQEPINFNVPYLGTPLYPLGHGLA